MNQIKAKQLNTNHTDFKHDKNKDILARVKKVLNKQ